MSRVDTGDEEPASIERLLNALSAETTREILTTLSEPMTVAELVAECDISSSTVYRRLNLLSDIGVVEEQIVVNGDGEQCSRYERNIERFSVSVGEDGQLTARGVGLGGDGTEERTWNEEGS
ncbi:winged helix-turn-helix domain-containing protein [Halorubrum sp. PV6]|uniref:winged helix-turn-helix domain-containing protein n=1 Tax=Halorubrum sp. PV6 TaxID=634157 RepID=UPI000F85236A|nr:winged helix-turn-helix domain-containing protein [Halorubrum sp. PV6]AZQ15283.1 ArsR family transcriptional regulator [Halorubrum sp. PV6]